MPAHRTPRGGSVQDNPRVCSEGRGGAPLGALCKHKQTDSVPCGHGSKLNHQELDHRFWSMFPFPRIPFWGYPLLSRSHVIVGQTFHWGIRQIRRNRSASAGPHRNGTSAGRARFPTAEPWLGGNVFRRRGTARFFSSSFGWGHVFLFLFWWGCLAFPFFGTSKMRRFFNRRQQIASFCGKVQ